MRFLSKFFKRWYLYVLPLIIIPVVVTIYAKNTLSVYESTALLYINGQPAGTSVFNSYLSPSQNGANAMSEALQSESFCVLVAKSTDLANQLDLNVRANDDAVTTRIQSEITIAPTAVGQNLVSVTVDDKSPQMAQQIANAFVAVFPTFFADSQLTFLQKQIALENSQLDTAHSKLLQDQTKLQQYYQAHPQCLADTNCSAIDPALSNLIETVSQDSATVNDISSKLNSLQLQEDGLTSGAANLYYVSDAPTLPLHTTLHLKKLIVYPIGGLAAAIALIVLIVGIQTMSDKRVYSTQDLKLLAEDMDLNIPAIESVPVLRGLGRPNSQDDDTDGALNGILLPVLTVLPQLGAGQMTKELRHAIGVTVEGEE